MYTLIHNEVEADMATTKRVGIREFRAGLAEYIDGRATVAVTRHGQTVGIFIPVKPDLSAELAAFKKAKAELDAVLQLSEDEVEEIAKEFDDMRRQARHNAP